MIELNVRLSLPLLGLFIGDAGVNEVEADEVVAGGAGGGDPNFRKVRLLGVAQNICIESLTHWSMSTVGRSLNNKMQSLNSDVRSRSRNWYKMASATHSGNEELPNNSCNLNGKKN